MGPNTHDGSEPPQSAQEKSSRSTARDALAPPAAHALPDSNHDIHWIFFGPQGLRAGWSVLIFAAVLDLLRNAALLLGLEGNQAAASPATEPAAAQLIAGEGFTLVLILIGLCVVSILEQRSLMDYNLSGPRRSRHLFAGAAAGFASLSLLAGALAAGGWMRFHGFALTGSLAAKYAVLWGVCFLLVGCVEEGIFRCYLQFTLTRGIGFWWALALIAAICADLAVRGKGNGSWGVYAMAILGLVPCYILYRKATAGSGFWFAAWVTSTLFGFVHTGNGGENPIGIFQAALIGVIFCLSIRLTGSAWWAIGCHAGWDWAQTFFYGAPDSGLVAQGHLLRSSFAGKALFSGGMDGPEGSILATGVILLLLVFLLIVYGRRSPIAARAQ